MPVPNFATLAAQYAYWLTPSHILKRFKGGFSGSGENGVDIAMPVGTPVYAVAGGPVVGKGYYGGGGVVSVKQEQGKVWYYQHLDLVEPGIANGTTKQVQAGQLVGWSGGQNTGGHHPSSRTFSSIGPHIEVGINAPWQGIWGPAADKGANIDPLPTLYALAGTPSGTVTGTPVETTAQVTTTADDGPFGIGKWLKDNFGGLFDFFGNPINILKLVGGAFLMATAIVFAFAGAARGVAEPIVSAAAAPAAGAAVGAAVGARAATRPAPVQQPAQVAPQQPRPNPGLPPRGGFTPPTPQGPGLGQGRSNSMGDDPDAIRATLVKGRIVESAPNAPVVPVVPVTSPTPSATPPVAPTPSRRVTVVNNPAGQPIAAVNQVGGKLVIEPLSAQELLDRMNAENRGPRTPEEFAASADVKQTPAEEAAQQAAVKGKIDLSNPLASTPQAAPTTPPRIEAQAPIRSQAEAQEIKRKKQEARDANAARQAGYAATGGLQAIEWTTKGPPNASHGVPEGTTIVNPKLGRTAGQSARQQELARARYAMDMEVGHAMGLISDAEYRVWKDRQERIAKGL